MSLRALMDSLEGVDPSVAELYTERNGKFELTGIDGVKSQGDIDRLMKASAKEREDHRATKERFAILGDQDPTDIMNLLDSIPELKAAADGKSTDDEQIQNLVNAKLKTTVLPLERNIKQLMEDNTALAEANASYARSELSRKIQESVLKAGRSLKVLTEAEEDMLLHADRTFEVVEGEVLTKDNVGVTPGLNPDSWLREIQPRKSLWWGPSQGGGAPGGRSNGGGENNPFSAKHWNMTQQGVLLRENRQQAERLAQAAGTTVGGKKPSS